MTKWSLMEVQGTGDEPPSLAEAAEQLGVRIADIDPDFGLVLVDDEQKLYSLQVCTESLPAGIENRIPFRGPYSDIDFTPDKGETPPSPGVKSRSKGTKGRSKS